MAQKSSQRGSPALTASFLAILRQGSSPKDKPCGTFAPQGLGPRSGLEPVRGDNQDERAFSPRLSRYKPDRAVRARRLSCAKKLPVHGTSPFRYIKFYSHELGLRIFASVSRSGIGVNNSATEIDERGSRCIHKSSGIALVPFDGGSSFQSLLGAQDLVTSSGKSYMN
jgi:hypothetical protein